MVIGQVLLSLVAAGTFRRVSSRWAATAAVVLALAGLVSVVSGFLDGGLANPALTGELVAYQVLLLVVTATVGVLAGWRAVVLLRRR